MEQTALTALERKPGKFREAGFVPGVLYGDTIEGAKPVKMDAAALHKVIVSHGSNAKVDIDYKEGLKSGFIKEVQRNAISKKIIHVDIQLVSRDQEIKLQIPVLFEKEDILAEKDLQVQVYKNTIGVAGTMDLMPDAIRVDVSEKGLGDTVAVSDLNLPPQLRVTDNEDILFGAIIMRPSQVIQGEGPAEQPTSEESTQG